MNALNSEHHLNHLISSEKILQKEEYLPPSIALSFRKRTFSETQGLLFQFFLKELFLTVEKSKETVIDSEDKMNVSLFFALELFFFQLLGSPASIGIKGSTGSLQKASLYLRHLEILDPLNLEKPLDNLFKLALDCYKQYKKSPQEQQLSKKQFKLSKALKSKIHSLQDEVQNFANLIEQALPLFTVQETVYFFLLKHYCRYDKSLDKPYFAKALYNQQFEGFASLNAFLLDRYSNKGFYHLLPVIEQKTQELTKLFLLSPNSPAYDIYYLSKENTYA